MKFVLELDEFELAFLLALFLEPTTPQSLREKVLVLVKEMVEQQQ